MKKLTTLFETLRRRLSRDERGVAMVEFALAASVLVVLLVGVADYGMAVYRKIEVASAARAGMQYALLKDFDGAQITDVVGQATTIDGDDLGISAQQFCECGGGGVGGTCDVACDDGSELQTFVTVSVSYTYVPLLLSDTIAMSESLTVRTD